MGAGASLKEKRCSVNNKEPRTIGVSSDWMDGWTHGEEGKTPETQGDSQQPGPSASHGSPLISPSAVKRSKNDTGRTVMVAFICNPRIQEAEWSQV